MNISRKAFLTALTLGAFVKQVCTPVMAFPFRWKVRQESPSLVEPPSEKSPPEPAKPAVYDMPGTRWNFNGKWNPSRNYMEGHLEGFHKVKLDLDLFSKEELKQIHDNLHNGYSALGKKGSDSKSKPRTYSYPPRRRWWFGR